MYQSRIAKSLKFAQYVLYVCAHNLYTESDLLDRPPSDEKASRLRRLIYSKGKDQVYLDFLQEINFFQTKFFVGIEGLTPMKSSRFEYAIYITSAKKSINTANWEKFLIANQIDIPTFANLVQKWLNNETGKQNTLRFVGPPNKGKTMITRALTQVFNSGYISKASLSGYANFCFSTLVNKTIAVFEEPVFQIGIAQDIKSIFAGDQIMVDVKYKNPMSIKQLPCIVTSNTIDFGRGFLSTLDEEALRTRCITFEINADFETKELLTSQQLYSLLLKNTK